MMMMIHGDNRQLRSKVKKLVSSPPSSSSSSLMWWSLLPLLLLLAIIVNSDNSSSSSSSMMVSAQQQQHEQQPMIMTSHHPRRRDRRDHHHRRQLQQQTNTTNEVDNNPRRRKLRFAMLSGGSSFFDPVQEGWEETCDKLQDEVECIYIKENWTYFLEHHDPAIDLAPCVPQMRELLSNSSNFGGENISNNLDIDGISVQCGKDHPVFHEARESGIPFISFDIPMTDEISTAYVGTDNYYLGQTMARLLRLLRPEGGTYHVVSFTRIPLRYQGFVTEIEKHNNRPTKTHWNMVTTNITGSPTGDNLTTGVSLGPYNDYIDLLDTIAEMNPTAIIFMYQTPMRHPNYTDFVERHRWRNITILGTQGNNDELELMARRYVDGLVGQVTYDMGRLSVEKLMKIAKDGEDSVPDVSYTKLVNYNLVPEALPDPDVDQSLLGKYSVAGFACFTIIVVSVFCCLLWTICNRRGIVIRASQPFFLTMTAIGVLIMASAIIPMSFDDKGVRIDSTQAVAICMSVPWLGFTGFAVTFSALFSKTWRVNRFFHSNNRFERIRVSEFDVLGPFMVIMTLNIIVLICWTVIDPLTYVRQFEDGTDLYNREIASNGYCRSEKSSPYLVPLALINFSVIVIACVQAYQARDIRSEFSEARWIGMTVFSILQAFITGIPIVIIVKEIPEAYYMVLTFLIFILSMAVLSLIFLPKVLIQWRYAKMSAQEQRAALAVSVKLSSGLKVEAENKKYTTGLRPSRPIIAAEKESTSSVPAFHNAANANDQEQPGKGSDEVDPEYDSIEKQSDQPNQMRSDESNDTSTASPSRRYDDDILAGDGNDITYGSIVERHPAISEDTCTASSTALQPSNK